MGPIKDSLWLKGKTYETLLPTDQFGINVSSLTVSSGYLTSAMQRSQAVPLLDVTFPRRYSFLVSENAISNDAYSTRLISVEPTLPKRFSEDADSSTPILQGRP